jgi:hypothetical protein
MVTFNNHVQEAAIERFYLGYTPDTPDTQGI